MWEIIFWIASGYLALCFLTALFLSKTPYSEVGLFFNALFAPVYWWDILRGQF